MNRKKTSFLWKFFSQEKDSKAVCNLCKQVMSYKTSTTNLKKHLERKHPLVQLSNEPQRRDPAPVLDENNESPSATPGPSTSSTPTTSHSTSENHQQPKAGTKQNTQTQLPYFRKSVNIHTKAKLDKSLMGLFTIDMQPFSVVEDRGFQKFVRILNPAYQLPSRKYISNTLLPALYEEKYNLVQEVVKNVRSVEVTTDCWTSINTESFMAVTIHFINDNFKAQSVLLECSSYPEAHTSVNLAAELQRITSLWGLENKILLAVSDNAASIQKAIKEDLKWRHFGCFAHTINLIVQNSLKIVSPIVSKVRTLVAHFKRSSKATLKFIEVQKQAGREPKKLLQDVVTRWNSTFYMLDRILELEEEVRTTMALLNVTNLPIISVEEWQFLTQLRNALKPMEEVTKIISGQKYVTLSSVIILTKGLESMFLEMLDENLLLPIQNLVREILKGITDRLGNLENSKTLLISTFLDPRFKNVGYSEEGVADRTKQWVENLVVGKINESVTVRENQASASTSTTSSSSQSVESPSVWGHFTKKASLSSKSTVSSSRSRAIIEVQRYLEEDLLDKNEDPLEWWRYHSYNYPYLSKVVIEKFGTVATSVPCERVFSKSGQLISERRSRISSNKVKQIMFLNVNSNI